MKFTFGDIVVVDRNLVGVVVKCWESLIGSRGNHYQVYVRNYNSIREYHEHEMRRFVYDKELSDEALQYYED